MTCTSVIEVGDVLKTPEGISMETTSVEQGLYGQLWKGHKLHEKGRFCLAYLIPELPPLDKRMFDWHGWSRRVTWTLRNGAQITGLGVWMHQGLSWGLADYDALLARTLDAMRSEEMQSRPTDIRLDS